MLLTSPKNMNLRTKQEPSAISLRQSHTLVNLILPTSPCDAPGKPLFIYLLADERNSFSFAPHMDQKTSPNLHGRDNARWLQVKAIPKDTMRSLDTKKVRIATSFSRL
jgi:uncharacterized Zn-finger protein